MGKLIKLYELQKKKIEQKHTIDGKLSPKGITELYNLAKKYGISKDLYFPSDYGTKDWHNRD